MRRVLIACLILACAALPRLACAQSAYVQQSNARLMDSLEMEVVAIWCHGQLDYPVQYNRRKTDKVIHVLRTLNSLYSDTLTRSGLEAGIRKFPEKHVTIDRVQNGDSTCIIVKISLPEYLQARLTFTCAGNRVIAQRYELQPETKIWADDHNEGFVDFNYCKTVYAPALNFPLRFSRDEYFYASLRL